LDYAPFVSDNFEGPFDTTKDIRKTSNIYKELLKSNPKRAEKIFEDKFIVRVENIIVFPDLKDDIFMNYIYKIMQHSLNGKMKSNDVTGIHLLTDKVKIIEILKENDFMKDLAQKID
jgi:ATP-dependent Clp protease ATP-binding subunit ClpA